MKGNLDTIHHGYHWMPQFSWVSYKNKLLVDKVYKLEDLNELVEDIQDKFEFKIEIPNLNSSIHSEKRMSLNERTKRIIEDFYYKDFQNLKF